MENEEEFSGPQPLTLEEARVLGCLIEKELTTPEYYPLTMNSLITACNQTTNRDPVLKLDETMVWEAINGLKDRRYMLQLTQAGARSQKYKHTIESKFPRLTKPEIALLSVLLLRGQQTAGELRQRTERQHGFLDIASVEHSLKKLIEYPEMPLAISIPAGGGRKAVTYASLLCGPVDVNATAANVSEETSSRARVSVDQEWKDRIERELTELRAEVERLKGFLE